MTDKEFKAYNRELRESVKLKADACKNVIQAIVDNSAGDYKETFCNENKIIIQGFGVLKPISTLNIPENKEIVVQWGHMFDIGKVVHLKHHLWYVVHVGKYYNDCDCLYLSLYEGDKRLNCYYIR